MACALLILARKIGKHHPGTAVVVVPHVLLMPTTFKLHKLSQIIFLLCSWEADTGRPWKFQQLCTTAACGGGINLMMFEYGIKEFSEKDGFRSRCVYASLGFLSWEINSSKTKYMCALRLF